MILCQKAKIDNQGRVAIPKELLEAAGLRAGDYLYITVGEQSTEIVIAKQGSGRHLNADFAFNPNEPHPRGI